MNEVSQGRFFSVKGQFTGDEDGSWRKAKFNVYDGDGQFLSYGKTSEDGRFKVAVPKLNSREEKVDLTFRLLKEEQSPDRRLQFMKERWEVAEKVVPDVKVGSKVDLGKLEFDDYFKAERVPLSYTLRVVKATLPAKIQGAIENLKERFDFFGTHDVSSCQNSFGVEATPLTAENSWKLMLNGICPLYLKKEGDLLAADICWDRYAFDKEMALPNVKALFKVEGEKGVLQQIHIDFVDRGDALSPEEFTHNEQVYRPGDEDFEEGLRAMNSALHVYGQTVYHLGIGHVYGSFVAQSAFDFLQHTTFGQLILPHTHLIRKISNELGKTAIFGEEGILNVSSLSVESISHMIADTLGALDPFSFEPREPLTNNHTFSKVQKVHYKNVREAVKEFFDKNWGSMVKEWKLVHAFFDRLHKKSVPYRPWEGVADLSVFQDANEIGGKADGTLPARTKGKESDTRVRSFRPIAVDSSGPKGNDREMMERFAADYIHHVTLWHSWLHRSQYTNTPDSPSPLDLNFAPITLGPMGKGPFGGITEKEAIAELMIADTFRRFNTKAYALMRDESVYPGLTARIKATKDEYLANGIDPSEEIQTSTVI
ncbi:hypothetical protein [Estrella lausannensis]|uniref:Lipoxygenase domain-containing protein n=1 Tax=Estrella lausannensis TaxID=483423 RepID=A0A0H5DPV6_9BACT|nr:hypothetical protein [Estrella lausannensis]CRX38616.1 conserved hypothetical protein [Estrella lausannensis]